MYSSLDPKIYIGKYDIFTIDELDNFEEIEQIWRANQLSTAERMNEFPEEKIPAIKREKKELGQAIDDLHEIRAEWHRTGVEWWLIQYMDENIERMAKRYHKLGNRLRYGKNVSLDKTDSLAKAKQFPIVDILGISPRGNKMMVRCPLHDDGTPSMCLYLERNGFHCFGCGEHGDVLDLYMKLNNVDLPTAIKALS